MISVQRMLDVSCEYEENGQTTCFGLSLYGKKGKLIMWIKRGFLFLNIMALFLLIACSEQEIANRLDYEIQNFEYTNQQEQPYSLADLKGKVWIANFIFTNCDTVCPMSTQNMAKLQQEVENRGLNLSFVSFSVDPDNDTPEKLKTYGEQYGADFSNWNFLTGYDLEHIRSFAEKSFRTIVQQDPSNDQVIHGTQFFLVDQDGRLVRNYSGLQDMPMDNILRDAAILLK